MGITALEIQNEGFEHGLRGYDVKQVDDFLERVATEVDAMNAEIDDLKTQLEEANEKLAEAEELATKQPEEEEPEEKDTTEIDAAVEKVQAELDSTKERLEAAEARARAAEKRAVDAEDAAKKAQDEVEPLKQQLEEKSKLDSAISAAFISAQRSADQMREEARAEGDRIYRESEAKAREFIREALAKKARIFSEIEALQKSSEEFRESYVAMVDKFANEARGKFAELKAPEIPDDIVNELLPDIDSMEVNVDDDGNVEDEKAAAASVPVARPDAPKLSTEVLPVIGTTENEE